jgi:hypothetical protein
MARRAPQPKCSHHYTADEVDRVCNHSLSFHSPAVEGRCTALGCQCPGFVPVDEEPHGE